MLRLFLSAEKDFCFAKVTTKLDRLFGTWQFQPTLAYKCLKTNSSTSSWSLFQLLMIIQVPKKLPAFIELENSSPYSQNLQLDVILNQFGTAHITVCAAQSCFLPRGRNVCVLQSCVLVPCPFHPSWFNHASNIKQWTQSVRLHIL